MLKIAKNIQSLHNHTTNSDGQFSPQETLKIAKKYGISAIAFTDHDNVLSSRQFDKLKKNKEVKWISGIEISAGWPQDIGGDPASKFHIAGLFINPADKNLNNYCQKMQKSRLERMKKIVKNLNSIGIKITKDDCLRESGGEVVGRPHIVKAILKHKENIKIIEKIKKDFEIASFKERELKKKNDYLNEGPIEQWPYYLFLDSKAFIKNIYVKSDFYLDFDGAVKLIRNAGGKAILAHYSLDYKDKISSDYLEKLIKEKRIDGLETVFGLYAYKTSEEKNIEKARKITKNIVKKYNCLESGGIDAHKEKDFQDFFQNSDFNKDTTGLLEKMTQNFSLNTEFSNLENF